jgi:hypothetical protein
MRVDFFLKDDELKKLTGRSFKSKQIQWIRAEGIPFRVSATGHPVVVRFALEGKAVIPEQQPRWVPNFLAVRAQRRNPDS